MQAQADALTLERAGAPRWRQPIMRSVQDRCDGTEFDRRETGRHAHPPYDQAGVVVVASAWLVFYVIATIHHFVASGI